MTNSRQDQEQHEAFWADLEADEKAAGRQGEVDHFRLLADGLPSMDWTIGLRLMARTLKAQVQFQVDALSAPDGTENWWDTGA